MQSLDLQSTPHQLFSHLQSSIPSAVLLESSYPHPHYGRYTLIAADPIASFKYQAPRLQISQQSSEGVKESTIQTTSGTEVLNALQELLRETRPTNFQSQTTFAGGAIGYFSYDFGQMLWPRHVIGKSSDWPECCFFIYDGALVYDQLKGSYHYYGTPGTWMANLENFAEVESQANTLFSITPLQSNISRKDYLELIRQIQYWIREGDVYQVNLSQQFTADTHASPWEIYQRLAQSHPAPFSGFFPVDASQAVLSTSPELFFRLKDRQALVRPIKGTVPRRPTPQQDDAAKQQLWNSIKDNAELLMIVDLERNDLGRVCEYGTVAVPELKTVESYASVHHLVASIQGTLREDSNVFDLIAALFPCGSVTGAPKLRAMERIEQLESFPRAVYTGSLGWIDFDHNAEFNVAIRTLMMNQSKLSLNLGGGIVIDSDPNQEYEETLHKGVALAKALGTQFSDDAS